VQLASAKTGDDTKGPEREKAKELPELSDFAKQEASNSPASPIVSVKAPSFSILLLLIAPAKLIS
jgi:hypothetical protein